MNKPIIDNSLNEVRSLHNTSCNWTGSADFGRLVPFHVEELDPTVHIKTCRPKVELMMLPLASPTFGKLDFYIHYFFVPTRLIWKDSIDVFARQGAAKNATPPYWLYKDLINLYNREGYGRGVYKHFTSLGIPPFFATEANVQSNPYFNNTTKKHTLLKFRAYQQIWWDFYRDPEVLRDDMKSFYLMDDSGRVDPNSNERRWQQFIPRVRSIKDCWLANLFASSGQEGPTYLTPFRIYGTDLDSVLEQHDEGDPLNNLNVYSRETSSQTLRKIEALTRYAERLSLGGKRAIDAMFAAYGVKPNFMKMQMAQYIGGAKHTVLVQNITSSADTVTELGGQPLGSMAGNGYSHFSDLDIDFTAPEHGYLVGIISIMPHIHFVQGMDKSWYRNTVSDFFSKPLERTGQVAVSKSEVAHWVPSSGIDYSKDDETFAFCQPYYENKKGQDILAGDFMYYHNNYSQTEDGDLLQQLQYMHSMEMFADFPSDRLFNADNLLIKPEQFNKIFFYLGGTLWDDRDDHFHLCIDKEVVKDTPYDGYAVPTVETTQQPHKASSPVGGDTVL